MTKITPLNIGIDASNLVSGGGATHLIQLLRYGKPDQNLVAKVKVFGNKNILDQLEFKPWLQKVEIPDLEKGLVKRTLWQLFKMKGVLNNHDCHILLNPGGGYIGNFQPFVTMCRNMLVFEKEERRRFGYSMMRIRLKSLNLLQRISITKAKGTIFVSNYAKNYLLNTKVIKEEDSVVIHHGISSRFFQEIKTQYPLNRYSKEKPFKLLYISTINVYKHQDKLAIAVGELINSGLPLQINMVGGNYPPSLTNLEEIVSKYDSTGKHIKINGIVPYNEIEKLYHECDGFIFASTCENMPNILIEAMTSGLPILCSRKSPMPEFIGNNCFYFDPTSISDTKKEILYFLENPHIRAGFAEKAQTLSQKYSWEKCAKETFNFLKTVHEKNTVQ